MLKTGIVAILYTLFIPVCHAQQSPKPEHVVMVGSSDLYLCDVYKQIPLQVIDTSELSFMYEVKYLKNAAEKNYSRDYWVLQIGDLYVKTYSQSIFRADSLVADVDNYTMTSTEERPLEMLLKNKVENRITEYQRLPLFQRRSIRYTEAVRIPRWIVENEFQNILNYPCRKAVATYRGRTWNVWFTEEIPVQDGPWKLSGLPGAVLYAHDATGSYVIECKEISQRPQPIVYYDCNSREVSKNKWKKHLEQNHLSPYSSVAQGGIIGYYTFGSKEPFGKEWTIPYNPLELE